MSSKRIYKEALLALSRNMSASLEAAVRDLAPTLLDREMRMPHEFCLRDASEEGAA
jgi:hypothetical protein